MRLVHNEKQKDNISKYLYDLSRICFAVAVIGPFAKPEIVDMFTFSLGVIATIICFIFALILDGKKF